jgi:hypothetical protein
LSLIVNRFNSRFLLVSFLSASTGVVTAWILSFTGDARRHAVSRCAGVSCALAAPTRCEFRVTVAHMAEKPERPTRGAASGFTKALRMLSGTLVRAGADQKATRFPPDRPDAACSLLCGFLVGVRFADCPNRNARRACAAREDSWVSDAACSFRHRRAVGEDQMLLVISTGSLSAEHSLPSAHSHAPGGRVLHLCIACFESSRHDQNCNFGCAPVAFAVAFACSGCAARRRVIANESEETQAPMAEVAFVAKSAEVKQALTTALQVRFLPESVQC